MKSMQLTLDHKAKLMEMISKLFPEFLYVEIMGGNCNDCALYTLKLSPHPEPHKVDNEGTIIIHWFEFMLKQLCTRLFRDELLDTLIAKESCACLPNPIGYLYETYKRNQK